MIETIIHEGEEFVASPYEGYYASRLGNVLSKRLNRAKVLKPTKPLKSRYASYCLSVNGRNKTILAHRVIAETWVSRDKDKNLQVNHKDGDRTNNHADNLEWVTASENTLHAHRTGLADIQNRVPVLDTQTGVYYDSIVQMGQILGFSESSARRRLAKRDRYIT